MNIEQLPHKVLDYSCPINALEDQYEWHTGTRLPGFFLMDLSTIGFLYIRHKSAPVPRMVFWGNGMGKHIHHFLADIVGYDWKMQEGGSFRQAWSAVFERLQQGKTAIIGLLDMYHLPYFEKFYHRIHVPQHFVHVIGFDETADAAIVLDNSLPGTQLVPLADLKAAWNVGMPGQGKPFTCYFIDFHENAAAPRDIAIQGLKRSADIYLHPANARFGCRAFEKFMHDAPHWADELDENQFKASLESLATFTCSVVPNLPQALLPYPLPVEDSHQACRDRFAKALSGLAGEYNQPQWQQTAKLFAESGEKIGQLTDLAVQSLLQKDPGRFTNTAPTLLDEIYRLEMDAFRSLI